MSFVVDNHEDEEDENSGHKIHQHLQHQDQNIKRGQSFVLIVVPYKILWWQENYEILVNLIFTMETVIVMKESRIETVLNVTSSSRSVISIARISGRL